MRIAVWLDWPISAFRLNGASLECLKRLAGASAKITVCRSERGFLRALPDATHALVWEFKKEWFVKARDLRVLATPSAGRELIPADVPSAVKKWHGRFHGPIMAESVAAYMLALSRGIFATHHFHSLGILWPRSEISPFCSLVAGTKAVILGYGAIGHAIGAKLEALGVSFTGITRKNFGDLEKYLPSADWLVSVLPGDTGTDGIVNAGVLSLLPRRACVINVGRGNAVNEKDLEEALRKGRIRAAVLDVVQNEPMTASSPLAADVPGLFVMPHAAAFAPEYLEMFFRELKENGLLR